jgi:hypothetical protein
MAPIDLLKFQYLLVFLIYFQFHSSVDRSAGDGLVVGDRVFLAQSDGSEMAFGYAFLYQVIFNGGSTLL